jgi:hypothetical protein
LFDLLAVPIECLHGLLRRRGSCNRTNRGMFDTPDRVWQTTKAAMLVSCQRGRPTPIAE